MAQLEQINFSQPVTLFKRSEGMELLVGRQLTCGAGLLLLEEGANQEKGPVEDRKQGRRGMVVKVSATSALGRCWLVPS